MKNILLFGAGKSATCLIDCLLANAPRQKWHVTVADHDLMLIKAKTGKSYYVTPAAIDIKDQAARQQLVQEAAKSYLDTHPGANQAVSTALTQPRDQAAATLRGYFTSNPQEYYDLRGILSPIGDTQRTCNVTALSPELSAAYNEFMAG